eukprot:15363212-Ditylum_brightwellii.AAC.1
MSSPSSALCFKQSQNNTPRSVSGCGSGNIGGHGSGNTTTSGNPSSWQVVTNKGVHGNAVSAQQEAEAAAHSLEMVGNDEGENWSIKDLLGDFPESTKPIKPIHWNRMSPNDVYVAIIVLIGSDDKDNKDKNGGNNGSASNEDDE